jgi:hypothetical protein
LVPAERAKLQASVNSVGSASPFPVKTATVANTTNARGEIAAQTNKLLGDSRVPPPDFSGAASAPAATSTSPSDDTTKQRAAYLISAQEFLVMKKDYDAKYAIYRAELQSLQIKVREAKNTLPEGDPGIESLKRQGRERATVILAWDKEAAAALEAKRQQAIADADAAIASRKYIG